MDTIDHFNLRSFDLNLLIAFDVMMQELNVTKSAEKLRIGQSAMSHNLATLRMLLDDELFYRVGQTMRPTARALALAGSIRAVLVQAQHALSAGSRFDPATEKRAFRIGLTDEMEMFLLPALISRIHAIAPGVGLLSRAVSAETVGIMMNDREIDIAIGSKDFPEGRCHSEVLFESEVVCCFNPDLFAKVQVIDRETYLGARHALLSQTSQVEGCIGMMLRTMGIGIDVALTTSDFMPVLSAARHAPLIATVPARLANEYAPLFGLSICPMPISLPLPPVRMGWPVWSDKDAGSAWLRDMLRDVVKGMAQTNRSIAAQ
ncbi:LysR family transcriptional regulator [Thalassospira profundimaris]|uniref:LysR family transcriptional regulator n=1 Tax=Thalassospira profundimaris TaxID=502049 RepID=A0A367XKV7_9PROT|nr:LysR family transcriptional regulator [Thalassospira profundimaris]RCK54275.1 LysR family transcriptional regulator [Thalassospira profundimaris]